MREPPQALRLLLWLYPPRHRRAYGAEMWEVTCYRHGKGVSALELALDLVWSALCMWAERGRRRMMAVGIGRGMVLDLRFVARSLWKSPGYAATAVVVLAAAVAVNMAVLSYVRGTLLREATYPEAARVVVVWGSNAVDGQVRDVISGPVYLDLARATNTLEALAAFHGDDAVLLSDGRPEVLAAHSVSVDFFDVVPVQAALGRVFDERERMSGGGAVALVSHPFWWDRLASDPAVVGQAMNINGEPHTILGVLPEGFEFATPAPIWLPLRDDALAADDRSRIHYHLFGRRRPGVTAADVTGELSAILARQVEEYGVFRGWSILAEPMRQASVMAVRSILWTVAAAVGLVLLIALVNLATLFRIRTLGRENEVGVRLALGAGWRRVARVLALEALVLAGAGAGVGLMAAPFLLDRIRQMVPMWVHIPDSAARIPVLQALLDPWVIGVTAGLTLLGALILVAPGLVSALRQGGLARRGRQIAGMYGTRWLVIVELGLATVLCLGAGLTTRSAMHLLGTDVGVDDSRLLTMWVGDVWELPEEEQVTFFEEVARRVEALPAVASAAFIDYPDFQGEDDYARVYFLDRSSQPVEDLREEWRRVTQGLFETAGMSIVQGRTFTSEDFQGTPRTAIVNQAFAAKHYADGQALGQFLSTHDEDYRDLTIVGIVADVRSLGPQSPAPPMLYVPIQGSPRGTMALYARWAAAEAGSPSDVEQVRETVWSVDPLAPIAGVYPMSELVDTWVAIPRAVRTLVSGLATLALILAAVGVFGVVAYAVRRRTAEFGVRLALGASPDGLKRTVVMGAVPLVVMGVGAGLVAGYAAARGARAVLFGVSPLDPLSVGGALAAMVGVALLATYLPVRRVSRIDPTEAMRVE